LADEHGLQLYSTDDAMAAHAARSTPAECPHLHRFMAMDMDERWVNRSPEEMLETFHWFRGEGFGEIVQDVLSLPPQPAVIVEGFRLLPSLVQPLLAESHHAVWLLPDPSFRKAVFQERGGEAWLFLAKTSDPERALSNLLERDALFTEHLRGETTRLGLHSFEVGPGVSEDEVVSHISHLFRL
jgi:hypothetical protein